MLIENSSEESGDDESVLEGLFQALLSVLHAERDALIQHDGARLDELSPEKLNLCNRISQQLSAAPSLAEKITQAATDTRAQTQLEPVHISLARLAKQARDYNLVNGKILHRSQQSIREILGIMSGQSIDGLYGQSGQQDNKTPARSGAFIRA
ncbi:MAG: flagellar export chaperone FlgN [bacterium]